MARPEPERNRVQPKSQETRTRYCEKTTNVRANGLVRLIWMWDFFFSVHLASPPHFTWRCLLPGKRLGNGCPFIYFSLSFLFPGPYPPFSGEMVGFSFPWPAFSFLLVVVRRIFFRSLLVGQRSLIWLFSFSHRHFPFRSTEIIIIFF